MARVICDFNKQGKIIRPQHGLCNYPTNVFYCEGSKWQSAVENTQALFSRVHTPVTRIKDQLHFGYGKCVEIPFIFRDFRKDENDPASYFFYNTDNSVSQSAKACEKVIYRLGAPREFFTPRFSKKPADYGKFAAVCVNIVRHVNDGWAKGMHAGIKYWEIWNRADDKQCWPDGTYEDYYRLYAEVAKRIKELHPRLKVGGPAAGDCSGDNGFLRGFLAYVKENDLPCDFVSWNFYGTDVKEAVRQAKEVKRIVKEAALGHKVEIINDEWNCMTFDENGRFSVPHVRDMYGAAFDAAFMIAMQKEGMDFSTYYDAQKCVPWGGLIDHATFAALKPLYSFAAFSDLYALKKEASAKTAGRDLYALAAANNEKKALLISFTAERKTELTVETGISEEKKVYLLDKKNDLTEILTVADPTFTLKLNGPSVILVKTV